MAYATVQDVQARMTRTLGAAEQSVCTALLEDAAVIIDAYNRLALDDTKNIVSCRMVCRALGDGADTGYPMGASQGSMSGLGYSQSWTMGSGGATGEVYLSKIEKTMLGLTGKIGIRSPLENHTGVTGCEG